MPANNRRTLVSVDVTDVEKRKFPSKHYSYVIKVCWTDDSETVIYRRYSKFFEFQIILLETFPYDGGLKEPSARIIPFLPGKILFRRSHVRDVAMKRLKPIDEYCKALILLPKHISESDHVLDFFETKYEDLNPVRDESTRRRRREDQASLPRNPRLVRRTQSLDIGEISGPILLEQYVAIADYVSTQNKELTITNGQHVEVIEKNENGWWFVSDDEGERGWVPGVYLERPDGSVEDLVTNQAEPGQGEHYLTTQAYTAENADDVSFGKGVTVEVLQKNLEGWWLISHNGKQGHAPASYLEKAHNWVQGKHPVQIINSIHDLKHRHSLPANSLSMISNPSKHVLNSSSCNLTPTGADKNQSDVKSLVSSFSKDKTVQPPPKRSSVKRFTKKRPDGPPPLPPVLASDPTYEYMTVAPFNANIPDGVSFSEEKKVEVLEKSPGGWWFIKIDGSEGWAPSSYIEKREATKKVKAAPPNRPGPPKLSRNNPAGSFGVNGNASPSDKVQPAPARIQLCTSRSQSIISPAKRPLPPLPMSSSASCLQTGESETYEEVGANVVTSTIDEEIPALGCPPLPPTQEAKKGRRSPEHAPKFKSNSVAKTEESGEIDFRSVLKSSIAAKRKELKSRQSNSPPRPPTKPGAGLDAKVNKPKVDNIKTQAKPARLPGRPSLPRTNGSVKSADKPASVGMKTSVKLAKFQEAPPKLPPKPKPSLKKVTPVMRHDVMSSDDGAIVDFRSVLRSTQRKESTGSNGVGRSKSFNADKFISTKTKMQQNKPPVVPKKPPNLPLKPPIPTKMKGLDGPVDDSENDRKVVKPPRAVGKKPVLRRFQVNNSNSNVKSESKKPVFVVGHVQVEPNVTPDLGTALMKRGSPDGQVDEKYDDKAETTTEKVVPPERLKKLPKDKTAKLAGLDFKAKVEDVKDKTEQKTSNLFTAISNYEGLEECEISFSCGDKAEVVEKGENSWWYVSIKGKVGWAPSSFFQPEVAGNITSEPSARAASQENTVPDSKDVDDAQHAVSDGVYSEIEGEKHTPVFPGDYRAAADFEAQEVSMLSLHSGDEVTVMQEADGGWWFAVLKNGIGEGWVPSTYLDPA